MSKKLIALVLAFALVFSTFSVAFAEEPISVDAQAAQAIGMLNGEGYGVNAAYLAKTPTRLQAAILFLRLKGLENEALAYTNANNFADAKDVKWVQGKNVMAYLKNHAELGWTGVGDNNFAPNREINVKEYYKVMLESLGYKQTSATVIGEFSFGDVLTFAAEKGLSKVAAATDFTNNDIAVATIEALKANVNGSTKTLAASLVEAGVINETKAIEVGIYVRVIPMVVNTVSAISNNKIEIALENAINAVPQANLFTVKDLAGNAVTVKTVALSADKKVVTITTNALTAYAPYTVAVGGVTKSIVALAADTTKPVAPSVVVKGNTTVEVTFAEDMDKATAENIANYTIDNSLTVVKAELNSARRVVTLTTSAQAVGTLYKATVQNVADLAGNVMDKAEGIFGGMAKDTAKPTVGSVVVKSNTTIEVTFAEKVNETIAENIANYVINNNLSVVSAELDTDDTSVTYMEKVTLTTSAQTVGTLYTVTIQNVADLAGNTMDKKEAMFGGMAKDTTKPAAPAVVAIDNNKVTVTFAEDMNKVIAENIANYAINNNLTVLKAELDSTKRIVTLTTSAQTVGTLYTTTIQNVADLAGNVMDKAEKMFGGMAKDTVKPTASIVVAANTITITYSEKVNKTTATELVNYVFDGGLGYATKATINAANTVVTLTVASMTPSKIYNLTINNVEDINGNVIEKDTKKPFVGAGSVAASSITLQTISTVNNNTIDLVFDKELTTSVGTTVVINKDNGAAYVAPAGLVYTATLQQDKKVVRVQFKNDASSNPVIFADGHVYELTVTGVANLVTTNSANVKVIAGTSIANEAPAVLAVTAINSTAVKVVFNENVTSIDADNFTISPAKAIAGVSAAAGNEVTLYLGAALQDGVVYSMTFNAGATAVKDEAGYNALKLVNADATAYTVQFGGLSTANVAPKIAAIIPVDKYTFEIIFSEPVTGATDVSKYSVPGLNLAGANLTASSDGTKVTVQLDSAATALVDGTVYELTYNKATGAIADKQALAYDTTEGADKVKFAGSGTTNAKATIISIAGVDSDTIKVYFSEKIDAATSAEQLAATYAVYDKGTTNVATTVKVASEPFVYNATENSITLDLTAPLNPALIYDLRIVGAIKDMNQQTMDTTASYNFTVAQ